MNQHLEVLHTSIQQSSHLTEEEKAFLIKTLTTVDKELAIALFKLDRTEKVKRTTAILLEETIEELEQKRKAVEQQNRDLEIEASLERIRTQVMGMQKSDELLAVCRALFTELHMLGFTEIRNTQIGIANEDEHAYMNYECYHNDKSFIGEIPYASHPFTASLAKKMLDNKEAFFHITLTGDELDDWRHYLKQFYQKPAPKLDAATALHYYYYSIGPGGLGFCAYAALTDLQMNVLRRFRNVFDLAYRRYADVKQAEAQAKESKIEAALERVRATAMAMNKPEDMLEICRMISGQLQALDIAEIRNVQTAVFYESKGIYLNYEYYRLPDQTFITEVEYALQPDVANFVNQMLQDPEAFFTRDFVGQEVKDWVAYQTKAKQFIDPRLDEVNSLHYYFFSIGPGALGLSTYAPLREEHIAVFKRFRHVFALAYRRFMDIQQAIAQAREAEIEASLERVRSRTLAMHASNELAETAAVVFRQLIGLGISPTRLYIGIIHDESGDIELWATDEDGSKVNTQFTGNIYKSATMHQMFEGWKEQRKSLTIDMTGKALSDYFAYLSEDLKVPFRLGLDQKRRVQTIAFFSKGFIGIASPDPQPEETSRLLERFAYVLNLTFTRFNDLVIAEQHAVQAERDLEELKAEKKRAEEALHELKATQTQLIQAEKMASLGELTAGIAHEIQNPLNFVNNFSDVSTELVDEMNEEIEQGHLSEAKVLSKDLKENLEKITYHGKRADAIVKSMLQHSRTSTGQKELTDINALADEYLRLAYHGYRAKDKSFNVQIKTEFDPSLPFINVVPQDIGRVLLNLINNAFQALSSPQPHEGGFSTPDGVETPTVIVSTKQWRSPVAELSDKVAGKKVEASGALGAEIRVRDNGPGIPQHILDKIFQPFFTTKPTGQGTGLGLSLSYDIIKAHGGELNVETKEGEGTTFIVRLPV